VGLGWFGGLGHGRTVRCYVIGNGLVGGAVQDHARRRGVDIMPVSRALWSLDVRARHLEVSPVAAIERAFHSCAEFAGLRLRTALVVR
jgi:hypothetical protein